MSLADPADPVGHDCRSDAPTVSRVQPSMSGRSRVARSLAVTGGVLFCTAMLPSVAHAHGFVGDGGPAAGLIHPLTGADHLLAMLTVGVLSAQLGGRAIWVVPTGFVTVMIIGGLLGATGARLPGAEIGVSASVVALGLAVALGQRMALWIATALAGAFGLYHGFAHGVEMPRVATPALYALGFAATTAGLHVMGALSGLLVLCRHNGVTRLRWIGSAVGVAGIALIARSRI